MKEFWYQSQKVECDREWFSSYEDAEEFAKSVSRTDGICNIVQYDEEGRIYWKASYEYGKRRK